jgi:diacylglycerol kinase
MKESNKFSIRKRIKSFSFAFNGIIKLIKNEHNARIHLVAMICVVIFGILLKIEPAEWISIVIVVGLVLLSELFNTAIEKLADMVDPEWNTKIGHIKDYSAGAVLISAIIAFIAGGLIFIPKIIELI